MNNKFFNALQFNDEFTENMMPTHSTSGSALVDLFFKMGGLRHRADEIIPYFIQSFHENQLYSLKAMFYNRDIRGGQGERDTFRVMLRYLARKFPEIVKFNIKLIPEYGRWDDLFALFDTPVETDALELLGSALIIARNKLCAKWMPREGKKYYKDFGDKLRAFLGLSPRDYRKLLSGNTQVVETLMCQKRWKDIVYESVPSLASNKYRQAFIKNDGERYNKFVEDVLAGKTQVKASAIFPHDIVRKALDYSNRSQEKAIQAQWQSLPNFVPEGMNFIPICDVSGSMSGEPLEVCISLGIYLSERNKSIFKDGFITFSGNPRLQILKGSLVERIEQLRTADWETNTDLEAVFKLILRNAKASNILEEDMPDFLIILSDMQFDQCVESAPDNVYQMMERMYNQAGFKLPKVIFWNLRTSYGVPVKFEQHDTALVSGFSPSIMKQVLGGELNPLAIVLKTLDSERYSYIRLPFDANK